MVLPADTTLQSLGLQVHYKAYGVFVHPPETLDITNSAVWASSSPQIISIDNTGIATYIEGCGTNVLITATYTHNGSVMVGTATLTGMAPGCTVADRSHQLPDTAEGSSPNTLVGDFREEAFHQIRPGSAGRREVPLIAGLRGKPAGGRGGKSKCGRVSGQSYLLEARRGLPHLEESPVSRANSIFGF